jgi:hypothetical protein
MNAIEQQLQTLTDTNRILQLKAQYCDACDDDHNGDAVAALFIDNGRWHRIDQSPFIGKKAIAEYMFSIREAGGIASSSHRVSNPSITVSGDTALANWRFMMTYTSSGMDATMHNIIGRYSDSFIRVDGQWYFESINVEVEQRS